MSPRLRWTLIALFVAVFLLPLVPYGYVYATNHVRMDTQAKPETAISVPNPGADLWRDLRKSVPGVSQARGVDTNVLINAPGDDWRKFRMQQLVPWGGYLLGAVTALILIFFLIKGTMKIEGGRSGETLFRFTVFQRITHWLMGGLFVILALTGLVLLYGRFVLIPLLGPEGFSLTAVASKEVHNLLGPLFPVSILMLLVLYGAQNLYERGDLTWLLKGGGFFGGGHASAGRFNAGEKIFFWLTILLGIAVSVSGLVLDFPIFGQSREVMGLSHMVHGGVAVVFIAIALGHIFMATIGTEGTLDAMTSGYVDKNWARMHHDRWAAEAAAEGKSAPLKVGGQAAAGGH